MWAVVPIKQFGIAKMRLAAILSDAERIALVRAMLDDVLRALRASTAVKEIVVVSREPDAERLAAQYGTHYLPEEENDLSLAVTQGGRYISARGGTSLLCVPGDVPLVSASEIDGLAAQHPRGSAAVSLVSDRDGTGSNGLLVSPIDLMPFAYGANSFQLHTEAAQARGAIVISLELDGLSLDIDTPDDVRDLMDSDRDVSSVTFLKHIDVVSRLPPRHNVGHALLG
jgi:2-phospho-L-lactate guanylyltransferase